MRLVDGFIHCLVFSCIKLVQSMVPIFYGSFYKAKLHGLKIGFPSRFLLVKLNKDLSSIGALFHDALEIKNIRRMCIRTTSSL